MAQKPSSIKKLESEEFAKAVLIQKDSEMQVQPDGEVVDANPRACTDPFVRRLREQARAGVGGTEGLLPAATMKDLMDRAWGKVAERVKMTNNRPLEGMTDAELAERAETLRRALAARVSGKNGDM
jgi:hypothetical protein